MGAEHRLETERAAQFDGPGEVILLEAGAGRRHDADAGTGAEPRRQCHRF